MSIWFRLKQTHYFFASKYSPISLSLNPFAVNFEDSSFKRGVGGINPFNLRIRVLYFLTFDFEASISSEYTTKT